MRNHLLLGNWNALCDSCGRKFKASELKKNWQGLMVCEEDYELRHPSDFLRVQRERITVPWARPYPAQDVFVPGGYCTASSIGGMADQGTADCARADITIATSPSEENSQTVY